MDTPLKLLIFILSLLSISVQARTSDRLQELIERLDGTSSYIDGPNCWNGAIYAAGVVSELRMFHPDEWLYHLQRNCVKVLRPEAGDVGRIYAEDAEVHGFIYLSESEVFAKHGEQTQWGYRRMSAQEMLSSYERTRNCRINQDFSSKCYHRIEYYRCEGRSSEALELESLSAKFERLTFDETLRPRYKMTCESEVYKARDQQLISMLEDADKLLNVSPEYRAVVIKSYLEALGRIQVSHRLFRCDDRLARDRSLKELRARLKSLQE